MCNKGSEVFVVLLGISLSLVQALEIRLFIYSLFIDSITYSLIQHQNHFLNAFVVLGAVFSARMKR